MTAQKSVHIRRRFFFDGEKSVAEFLLEVAMEIEFGAARVDHDFAGVVVEKERDVCALGGYLHPRVVATLALPLPDDRAKEVARAFGDRCDYGVWSGSLAIQFDHAHGCAANFGNRSVENEVPALQQAEAVEKKVKAGAKSDGAPGDGADGIIGMKQQNKRNQNDLAR